MHCIYALMNCRIMKRHLSDRGIMPPMKRSCLSIRNTAAVVFGTEEEEAVQLGTETEAEKHMRLLLEKQLDKKITLKDQFAQHRAFTTPCTYTPLTALVQGTCSLENYRTLENGEEKYQQLQSSGLTKEEIEFYLAHGTNECQKPDKGAFLMDPEIERQKLQQINEKIISHRKELEQGEVFAGAKTLGRHAMEIEKTLYAGCSSKKQLGSLIRERQEEVLNSNDPFHHIKMISDELSQRVRKERRKKRKLKVPPAKSDDVLSECKPPAKDDAVSYDPSIHHVIVPLEAEEVTLNKLSLKELKELPKFKDYEPGEPNTVLYVKNLDRKVTIRDLQAIFGLFNANGYNHIDYKLVKRQGFITFPDEETATEALEYANGYLLRNRPIVIQYGRRRQNNNVDAK